MTINNATPSEREPSPRKPRLRDVVLALAITVTGISAMTYALFQTKGCFSASKEAIGPTPIDTDEVAKELNIVLLSQQEKGRSSESFENDNAIATLYFLDDHNPDIRRFTAYFLLKIDPDAQGVSEQHVRDALTSDHHLTRLAAACALAEVGSEESKKSIVPLLRQGAEHDYGSQQSSEGTDTSMGEAEMINESIEGLAFVASEENGGVQTLRKLLHDPNFQEAAAAALHRAAPRILLEEFATADEQLRRILIPLFDEPDMIHKAFDQEADTARKLLIIERGEEVDVLRSRSEAVTNTMRAFRSKHQTNKPPAPDVREE